MHRSSQRMLFDLPGRYRIRVQGFLSASHSARLDDMAIATKQPTGQMPVTTLTGDGRDPGRATTRRGCRRVACIRRAANPCAARPGVALMPGMPGRHCGIIAGGRQSEARRDGRGMASRGCAVSHMCASSCWTTCRSEAQTQQAALPTRR